jgi:RNA polymerase sigma-70 factor, ECF subfamily
VRPPLPTYVAVSSAVWPIVNGLVRSLTGFRTFLLPAAAAIPFGNPAPRAFSGVGETNPYELLSHKEGDKKDRGVDEDGQLVSACRDGDTDAFEHLVRKYQTRMINIAFRMTGDYDDACEVVQETFLSTYRSIRKFRGDAKFSTWLYGICLNHARNRLGQVTRRSHHEVQSLDDPIDNPDGPEAFEPATRDPSVLDRLERKELQEKVQECIDSLEERYREVLVLRDIEGFSYEEIADILKIPDGTIKSRLFRARDTLRKGLKTAIGDY